MELSKQEREQLEAVRAVVRWLVRKDTPDPAAPGGIRQYVNVIMPELLIASAKPEYAEALLMASAHERTHCPQSLDDILVGMYKSGQQARTRLDYLNREIERLNGIAARTTNQRDYDNSYRYARNTHRSETNSRPS